MSTNAPFSHPKERIRVLLVDDEELLTKYAKKNLEDTGLFTVQTENWALNAIPTALKFRPDVILLDVMMPDSDGGAVAEEMLKIPRLRDIPILFLTAVVSPGEVKSNDGKIGGRTYIAKPARTKDLTFYLQQAVGILP